MAISKVLIHFIRKSLLEKMLFNMFEDFCKEHSIQSYRQEQKKKKIKAANNWLNKMTSYKPPNDSPFDLK